MGGCYCDYGDADHPEFYHVKSVKTRKPAKCSECRSDIPVGATCERTTGKWDGDVRTFRMCAECMEFRAWAEAHIPCLKECGSPLGSMHENILETMQDWDSECPGLYAEAQAKSKAIWKRNLAEAI